MNNKLASILIPATLDDYPFIQKMWPFYVYDLGRECGFTSNWQWPTDSSFVPDDLTHFFRDQTKKPFLIKVNDEVAGFALINDSEIMQDVDFYLSEFFILAKFQNKGIGREIAFELFKKLKGKWAIGIIAANKKALIFWQETLKIYTEGDFAEYLETISKPYPMTMLTFDSSKSQQLKHRGKNTLLGVNL